MKIHKGGKHMLWEYIKEIFIVSLTLLIVWATITTGRYLRKQYIEPDDRGIVFELVMFILLVPVSIVMFTVSLKLFWGWLI